MKEKFWARQLATSFSSVSSMPLCSKCDRGAFNFLPEIFLIMFQTFLVGVRGLSFATKFDHEVRLLWRSILLVVALQILYSSLLMWDGLERSLWKVRLRV